jgi:hypothetical protein
MAKVNTHVDRILDEAETAPVFTFTTRLGGFNGRRARSILVNDPMYLHDMGFIGPQKGVASARNVDVDVTEAEALIVWTCTFQVDSMQVTGVVIDIIDINLHLEAQYFLEGDYRPDSQREVHVVDIASAKKDGYELQVDYHLPLTIPLKPEKVRIDLEANLITVDFGDS